MSDIMKDIFKHTDEKTMQYMLDTINARAKEMLEMPETKAHMMTFKTNEEGIEWLHHAAICTLMGVGRDTE